jgi:hypothetical protein
MADSYRPVQQRARSVDLLFAHLNDEHPAYTSPAPNFEIPSNGRRAAPLDPHQAGDFVQAPPAIEGPADVQIAHEWLKSERERLDAYTRSQFETIERQHQALLAKHFRGEEALALRSQELNREMQFLASQAEALQRRARELTDREAILSGQMQQLADAQAELLTIQTTSAHIQRDTDHQRLLLEKMRAETVQLQQADLAARARFDSFETALRQRQQAWEKKQAELTERQAQMEQRYEALEQAEEALKRRMAELDELEDLLRLELEQQERQLAAERRENEALRQRLRQEIDQQQPEYALPGS